MGSKKEQELFKYTRMDKNTIQYVLKFPFFILPPFITFYFTCIYQ